jgi:hypothetical protein
VKVATVITGMAVARKTSEAAYIPVAEAALDV